MDIFKIIGVGLIGGILSMTVKQYKKEYALLVALATVTVILFFTLDTLETAISQISLITEKSGVDTRYFTAVMKVVGVAYITQFGAEILRDGGEGAIALKVELAGKVFILGLTSPIVTEFLEVCVNALLLCKIIIILTLIMPITAYADVPTLEGEDLFNQTVERSMTGDLSLNPGLEILKYAVGRHYGEIGMYR